MVGIGRYTQSYGLGDTWIGMRRDSCSAGIGGG